MPISRSKASTSRLVAEDVPGGKREIDASGLTILPGLIDIHLHFNEPGRADWEGAATGSRALAAGGGTLFFDMPLNSSPCTTNAQPVRPKTRRARSGIDYRFRALGRPRFPETCDELAELAERGVVGFKAFLCDSGLPEFPRADDLTLYEGMQAGRATRSARRGPRRERGNHQTPVQADRRSGPPGHRGIP